MAPHTIIKMTVTSPVNISGQVKSTKAEIRQTESFIAQVQDSLTSQLQLCTDPSSCEVLQLCIKTLNDNPELVLSLITKFKEAGQTGASPEAVAKFGIHLKQHILQQFDRELGAHFGGKVSSELAKHTLNYALAESRIPALQAVVDAITDNLLLKACIGEHIAAAQKQKSCAEQALLIAQLPKIIDLVSSGINQYQNTLASINAEQQSVITDFLKTQLAKNKAEISRFTSLLYDDTERQQTEIGIREERTEQLKKGCEQQKAHLAGISVMLEQEGIVAIPTDGLARELIDALHNYQTLQKNLTENRLAIQKAGQACDLNAGQRAVNKNQLGLRQSELVQNSKEITSEKEGKIQLEKECGSLSGPGNIVRHLKKMLGGGKSVKTRSEYRAEINKYSDTLQRLYQREQRLTQGINSLKSAAAILGKSQQHNDAVLHDHQKKQTALQQRITSSCVELKKMLSDRQCELDGNCIKEIEEVLNNYYERFYDEHLKQENDKLKCLEQYKTLNKKLEKLSEMLLSAGDFCDYLNIIKNDPTLPEATKTECENFIVVLAGILAQQSNNKEAIAELKEIKRLFENYNRLKDILGEQYAIAQSRELFDKVKKVVGQQDSIKFEVIPRNSINQMNTQLTHAATLFSMLCAEKIVAHPLAQHFKDAQLATPHTLILLDALETEINRPGQLETKTSERNRKGNTPAEQQALANKYLKRLRNIVSQEHEQFLQVAPDFSAQDYHAGQEIYIDRQGNHGTCVMHCWNNLMAYLTDNQQMQLTPWRTEKLIQALVMQSAHQHLNDLVNDIKGSGAVDVKAIEQACKQVVRASDMVLFSDKFGLQGHVMSFAENTPGMIEHNYLNATSTDLFNMVGINVEKLNNCHFNIKEELSDEAKSFMEKDYDAYQIGFKSKNPVFGHALMLAKKGEGYLLIDSNHDDPVFLKLNDLLMFFSRGREVSQIEPKGKSDSQNFLEVFENRHYAMYSDLIIHAGFYKKEKNNDVYS